MITALQASTIALMVFILVVSTGLTMAAIALKGFRMGLLFRMGSAWVGVHWSGYNKRLCVNVVPFVTFWVTLPGGIAP